MAQQTIDSRKTLMGSWTGHAGLRRRRERRGIPATGILSVRIA